MNLLQIAWRNLENRAVQTVITVVVVLIGVAMTLTVLMLSGGIKEGIVRASEPYGMIVGSKGSANQLIFNTIFLMDRPLGNLTQETYQSLSMDSRVTLAVPFALGDSYEGFRIVGTSTEFFRLKAAPAAPDYFRLQAGRVFEAPFEAVIGSKVAQVAGLRVGDRFVSTHGVAASVEEERHEEHPFTVVGVLDRVSAPSDKGIYVSMDSYWESHEAHEAHGADEADEADARAPGATGTWDTVSSPGVPGVSKTSSPSGAAGESGGSGATVASGTSRAFGESGAGASGGAEENEAKQGVTAVLVKPKSYVDLMQMYQEINRGHEAQAVFPGQVIAEVFDMMGSGEQILRYVSYVVLGMAGLTIVLALYGSAVERRRTVSILRAIGAGRRSIVTIVLLETALVVVLGCIGGMACGVLFTGLLSIYLGTQLSITVSVVYSWELLGVVASVALVGIGAGILPAVSAYRTETARYLNAM
ncbi:ABC transporter permease [Paenibacillus koleovorans]|uniref:ABC transporter permease n=1 Tax=Paenibacillus koleovorans TaxID=121608 RepID=UPI001FE5CBCA|nr:ABC transporter permease [Paenibacillus koleovorans]